MYIEKRRKDGRTQYYLAHSYRKDGKIKKIRVYLGADLSQAQVDSKKKEAEQMISSRLQSAKFIHDPYRTVLSPSELGELRTIEAKGKIKLLHLSEADWRKFTEAFTYDTNAIEGSSVTGHEVLNILEKNKWPEKPKEEISETYGVAEAVAYIRKAKDHVSLGLIKELHRIIFKNSKPFAGNFRARGKEVAVVDGFGNIIHQGAPSSQVASLLKELVIWYGKNRKKYPPLVLAAVVHNQFENIHPFEDGNGRVGRLLLINILLKHNFPPLNIELKNRKEYYAALQKYENSQNIRPMIELMLKEYRRLRKSLKKKM
ncbi:MAG: Fic family protein [Candidatus Micrarchaeota archaeon]